MVAVAPRDGHWRWLRQSDLGHHHPITQLRSYAVTKTRLARWTMALLDRRRPRMGHFLWLVVFAVVRNLPCTTAYNADLRFKVSSSIAKSERRALERQTARREVCDGCRRPPVQCMCDVLPEAKIKTSTEVLVLQHPTEFRRKTVSTVPLLPLVLDKVNVSVGSKFNDIRRIPAIDRAIQNGTPMLLLFPHEDAIQLDVPEQLAAFRQRAQQRAQRHGEDDDDDDDDANPSQQAQLQNHDANQLLILIDGTWTQAARMARHSPELVAACQKVQFISDRESIYNTIRKEPKEHFLSTLEACMYAMKLLEPDSTAVQAASDHLICALHKLVDGNVVSQQNSLPRFVNRGENDAKTQRRREVEDAVFGKEQSDGTDGNAMQLSASDDDRRNGQGGSIPHDAEVMPAFDPIDLGDGATLRQLSGLDGDWVDMQWPYRSKKSRKMVEQQLQDPYSACCSLGIEVGGSLKACILRYRNGALGMLHVDDDYRRRGYATALLKEATEIIESRGEACEAYIRHGNDASESLFRSLGWVRADPNIKGKSGNRRSKLKWIKSIATTASVHQEEEGVEVRQTFGP